METIFNNCYYTYIYIYVKINFFQIENKNNLIWFLIELIQLTIFLIKPKIYKEFVLLFTDY